MPKYQVRVTRSADREYADIEVSAQTWAKAKRAAIEDAAKNEDMYFGPVERQPGFYIDPSNDDEQAWLVEEEN